MGKVLSIGGCAGVFLVFASMLVGYAHAETEQDEAAAWKQTLAEDRDRLDSQKETIKSNAQAAHEEERALRDQIRQSRESGDKAAAASLRDELRSTHSENVAQKQSDMSELKDARRDLRSDSKAARFDRADGNDDGTLDAVETRRVERRKARSRK